MFLQIHPLAISDLLSNLSKIFSLSSYNMNLRTITWVKIILLLSSVIFILSNSTNPPNGKTGAPGDNGSCGGCHNGNNSYQGTASLSGIPSDIAPNTTYTVTLVNNVTNGSPNTAGFQLVVLDENNNNIGDLQDITSDVRTETPGSREYVEQNGDKAYSNGQVSWIFEWTSPATAPANGDITFYYAVNMSNNNGSTSQDKTITSSSVVNLMTSSPLTVSVSNINPVSCFGDADGSATAIANGGDSPYSYFWSSGETGSSATDLSAGSNSVTVTDNNGNTATSSFNVGSPAAITVISNSTPVSCFGGNDGIATAIPSGGTAPLQILWSNNETSPVINNLTAGSYTATITDGNQCQEFVSVNVGQPSPLNLNLSLDNAVSCFNGTDGAISSTVSGGTPPYSYEWSTSATTSSISGLTAGLYTLTVTDLNQCESIQNINLSNPSPLTLNVNVTNESGANANDGTATAIVSGGTGTISYSWSNGSTESSVSNLAPGDYTLTINDANDCTETVAFSIEAFPCTLSASSSTTAISCFGAADGEIEVLVSGATGALNFNWSHDDSLNSNTATGLGEGDYSVTITDAANCTEVLSVSLQEPSEIILSSAITFASCFGECDGSVDFSITGGIAPYTVLLSNGSEGTSFSNLCPGDYSVTVTDANNCQLTSTISIEEPAELNVSASISQPSCFGSSDGQIIINTEGGTAPYSFLWTTDETTESVIGLEAGSYELTITDANDCALVQSFILNQPSALEIELVASDETSNGANDGAISSTITGGTDPYTYLWSNGDTTSLIEDLSPGLYSLTVTDSEDCTSSASVNILAFDCALTLDLTVTEPLCPGEENGSVTVGVTGGDEPYSYLWSNDETGATISDLAAGTYGLTVTDASNCTSSTEVTINDPEELSITSSIGEISCSGDCDGSIIVSVTGGQQPVTYVWSIGEIGSSISNLCAGDYHLTVSDGNNCSLIQIFTLEEPEEMIVDIVAEDAACDGNIGDDIWAQVINGQGELSFNWSSGNSTADTISFSTEGDYSVTVTDELGCVGADTLFIEQIDVLSATANVTPISEEGASDGSIEALVSGGIEPYTYLWNNDETESIISELSAGEYTVTITDAASCEFVLTTIVEEIICDLTVSVSTQDVLCADDVTGIATVFASSSAEPLEYHWSDGVTIANRNDLAVGIYSLEVTDQNNCTEELSVEIVSTDSLAPVFLNVDLVALFDGETPFELTDDIVLSIVSDDCSIESWSANPSVFDCDDLGENEVDLEVCDINGNCLNTSFLLTLSDSSVPELTCPDDVVLPYCERFYEFEIEYFDLCTSFDLLEQSAGLESGAEFPIGVTTQNFTFSDGNDNNASCSFNVTVLAEPSIGFEVGDITLFLADQDTLIVNEPFTVLEDPISDGISYEWYLNGDLVFDGLNLVDPVPGLYTFYVNYGDACQLTYYLDIDISNSTINFIEQSLDIFPNPVTDLLLISQKGVSDLLEFELVNANGELLMQRSLFGYGNSEEIRLDNLSSGVYFVRFTRGSESYIEKIIKL